MPDVKQKADNMHVVVSVAHKHLVPDARRVPTTSRRGSFFDEPLGLIPCIAELCSTSRAWMARARYRCCSFTPGQAMNWPSGLMQL